MRVTTFAAGGAGAAEFESTTLVVRDANGNPIAIAVEVENGQTFVAHIGDDEFESLLSAFGVRASQVLSRSRVG